MTLVELEKITYDDIYPPFIPLGSKKPPALGSSRIRLPAPHYLLGWVVKISPEAEGAAKWSYEDFDSIQAWPMWRELGYEWEPALRNQGLIVPRVLRCGKSHAIFQIAHNYRRGIKFLETEAGKELVVSRALQVYKMDPKAYPDFPLDNLVWIRWPFERGAEKGLPCVGELSGSPDCGNSIPAPLADILQGKYNKEVP